ncbi:MAG TPA: MtrB/PioB family outer membrane beta-barrel protein [Gemmatimonadales bacterium]|nr:MtrB/PioB family outer membrane beta-barrel protein [Gemmatimonadales bacterium]
MRIGRKALLLLALPLLTGPQTAWGQGGVLQVAFALGGRAKLDSLDVHSRGKFEEYREVPTGPFLEALRVHYAPGDGFRSYTAVLRELAERDQSAWAGGSEPGRWSALVRWDRIPHTYSSTARMLGRETPRGTFTLPVPRPDTATWNKAAYLAPIRTRWDPVRASLVVTPSPHWDLKAEYTWLHKDGTRPMGMAFGSPGNNFREIPEPIDQTVQSLRLLEGYSHRRFQVQLGYDFSHFSNAFQAAIADNPLVATSSPGSGSAQGRAALAPNNLAHTLTASGALILPWHTRVTGSAALSWRRQNQDFLPATINTAISSPALLTIPKSLDGRVRTTLLSLGATSRPSSRLTLSGRLRHFRLGDNTAIEGDIPFVLNDRTLTLPGEEAVRFPHGKDNADLSATWRFAPGVSLLGGYAFERWERNAPLRNTRHTNEHAGRAALNFDASDWLQLRASVALSRRRIVGEYLAVTDDQLPTLRRFDQANRNRTRWEVTALLSPIDQLSLTATGGASRAKYPDSEFGLQLDHSWIAGGDLEWSDRRVTLGVGYTREEFSTRQRSKYREPTQLNNPSYDWVSRNGDFMDTFDAGASFELVPNRLEAGGYLEYARARLENVAFNPITPTGGTTAQNANAVASNWPDITQKWVPASAYLQGRIVQEWYATVRLTSDVFSKKDFRTDGLKPATGADIFLGNDYRDYTARFLSFTISYRPRLLRVGRSAL